MVDDFEDSLKVQPVPLPKHFGVDTNGSYIAEIKMAPMTMSPCKQDFMLVVGGMLLLLHAAPALFAAASDAFIFRGEVTAFTSPCRRHFGAR